MSYAREFAFEWVKTTGLLTLALVAIIAGIGVVIGAMLFPSIVGTYVEFGQLLTSASDMERMYKAHWGWLAAQYLWMLALVGAYFAFIRVQDRRAESNGGDSA